MGPNGVNHGQSEPIGAKRGILGKIGPNGVQWGQMGSIRANRGQTGQIGANWCMVIILKMVAVLVVFTLLRDGILKFGSIES